MATTSSNLTAGEAINAQGGNGNHGRYGLKAKLAAGMAILGCAAALTFGGLRSERTAPVQHPMVAPITAEVNTTSDLGTDYDPFVISNSQRRYSPAAPASDISTSADFRWDFGHVSDQFTYREDRRVDSAVTGWAPDFWTYREDRRVGGSNMPSDMPGETPCLLGGTAPCALGGMQPPVGVSTSADFRWDFGHVSDQFTYREDRRVESGVSAMPTELGPQELLPGEGPIAEDGERIPDFGPQP